MRSDTRWRWIYGGAAAVFLGAGLLQLLQGSLLGLAAVLSAALIVTGLVVWLRWPSRDRWGRLARTCGAITGIAWLLALVLGLFSWGGAFSLGAWTVGIAGALNAFFNNDSAEHTPGTAVNPPPGREKAAP
jgi:hypothetical protein